MVYYKHFHKKVALPLLIKYKVYSVYSARKKNALLYQEQKMCVVKKTN